MVRGAKGESAGKGRRVRGEGGSRKSLASVRTRSTSEYELLEGHELHGDGWQRRS